MFRVTNAGKLVNNSTVNNITDIKTLIVIIHSHHHHWKNTHFKPLLSPFSLLYWAYYTPIDTQAIDERTEIRLWSNNCLTVKCLGSPQNARRFNSLFLSLYRYCWWRHGDSGSGDAPHTEFRNVKCTRQIIFRTFSFCCEMTFFYLFFYSIFRSLPCGFKFFTLCHFNPTFPLYFFKKRERER